MGRAQPEERGSDVNRSKSWFYRGRMSIPHNVLVALSALIIPLLVYQAKSDQMKSRRLRSLRRSDRLSDFRAWIGGRKQLVRLPKLDVPYRVGRPHLVEQPLPLNP